MGVAWALIGAGLHGLAFVAALVSLVMHFWPRFADQRFLWTQLFHMLVLVMFAGGIRGKGLVLSFSPYSLVPSASGLVPSTLETRWPCPDFDQPRGSRELLQCVTRPSLHAVRSLLPSVHQLTPQLGRLGKAVRRSAKPKEATLSVRCWPSLPCAYLRPLLDLCCPIVTCSATVTKTTSRPCVLR